MTSILRSIIGSLQSPVILLLLLLIAVTILLFGTLIAEVFIERMYLKVNGKTLPKMVETIHDKPKKIRECIEESNLLKRQKAVIYELIDHKDITDSERESLAVRLIEREQAIYDRRVKVTDLIAKIGPMLGLMGTLIPLGPGIIALGQGDTFTLSNSLLIAFDTTVAGLICAFVALIISTIRKTWYRNYMSVLEMLTECVLEEEAANDKKK
ncbi:MAG: MotA/TolQ/ExbB proton channel family protein [Clostridiales bacterium]|nr:MotA/TolQ/ExbB proton channel family protein [Clostridiales bacterium]